MPQRVMTLLKRNLSLTRWFLFVLVVLIFIRALLPIIGLRVINWSLENKLGAYTGRITDFDLSLYRGAYQLQGLEIKKKQVDLPPLLAITEIDLSMAWRALLHRQLLLDVVLDQAVVRLVDAKDKQQQQFGTEESANDWRSVFDVLVPISIESLKVKNSAAYFTNSSLKQSLPVKLEEIYLTVEDLRTHARNVMSPFHFKAKLQDHAPVFANGSVDILSKQPRLDIDFQLTDFKMETLNGVLISYVPIDVTYGEFSVYGETAMAQGNGTGYVKLFFNNADIIADRQRFKTWKHFGYEYLTAIGNWLLKNPKTKVFAFQLPFKISNLTKIELETKNVFRSILDNRKKQLPRTVEQSIGLKDLTVQ